VVARDVIVAGAGIAGLTTAIALARAGMRATVLEQTPKLEEAGAGIQLSPNATNVLIQLGLGDRLRPLVMTPEAMMAVAMRSLRRIIGVSPLRPGEDGRTWQESAACSANLAVSTPS